MSAAPRPFARILGYAVMLVVWATLLVVVAFFAVTYAIYRDLGDSAHSRWTAGTGAERMAHDISLHFRTPIDSMSDRQLGYIPRPGHDHIVAPEYDIVLTTTADQVRQQPPFPAQPSDLVVMVGDSFTVGLGVRDDQTYSYLLQQQYHHHTINTGVPSYAAARELTWVRRLGLLKKASLLIVQFCSNDFPENRQFVAHPENPILPVDPEVIRVKKDKNAYVYPDLTYLHVVNAVLRHVRYKILSEGLWGAARSLVHQRMPGLDEHIVQRGNPTGRQLALDFLAVVDRFPEIAHTPMLVVELNERGGTTGFLPELAKLARDRPNLRTVPIAFKREDFYRFDGHLTPAGNRVVATALEQAIIELRHTYPDAKF